MPSFATYFVYPAELKNSARVHVFRDFLLSKAQNWSLLISTLGPLLQIYLRLWNLPGSLILSAYFSTIVLD